MNPSLRTVKPEPLPLDLETAPDLPRDPLPHRTYVGGVLYIEGLVVLVMGITLMLSYWPPVRTGEIPANPAGKLGMWLTVGSITYIIVVSIGVFLYNCVRPTARLEKLASGSEPGTVTRARRYASMKRRTRYIFDDTIYCERDAEEAMAARNMY